MCLSNRKKPINPIGMSSIPIRDMRTRLRSILEKAIAKPRIRGRNTRSQGADGRNHRSQKRQEKARHEEDVPGVRDGQDDTRRRDMVCREKHTRCDRLCRPRQSKPIPLTDKEVRAMGVEDVCRSSWM